MRTLVLSKLLFTVWITSGCRLFTSPSTRNPLAEGQSYWLDYDATRRGTLLVPKDKTATYCAEPSPDTALSTVAEIIAKGGYRGIEGEAQGKFYESILELGGRSQNILFLRESLYRLCELSNNANLDGEAIQTLYKGVLDSALKFAEATKAKADAEKSKAEAQKREALTKLTPGQATLEALDLLRQLPLEVQRDLSAKGELEKQMKMLIEAPPPAQ